MRNILARVAHPQTNGEIQRVYGEIQRKLLLFFDVAGPPGHRLPSSTRPQRSLIR